MSIIEYRMRGLHSKKWRLYCPQPRSYHVRAWCGPENDAAAAVPTSLHADRCRCRALRILDNIVLWARQLGRRGNCRSVARKLRALLPSRHRRSILLSLMKRGRLSWGDEYPLQCSAAGRRPSPKTTSPKFIGQPMLGREIGQRLPGWENRIPVKYAATREERRWACRRRRAGRHAVQMPMHPLQNRSRVTRANARIMPSMPPAGGRDGRWTCVTASSAYRHS